jgi:opacity protein-like surface antigen
MRKIAFVFVAVIFFSVPGFSQVPSGNVFFGYSYMSADFSSNRSNLNGWNASVEGKVLPLLGLVADFSGHYGSADVGTVIACPGIGVLPPCQPLTPSVSVAEHNFLFGPRLSISVRKFRPFVHALIGAGHFSQSTSGFSSSDTCFAYALGGGLDYHIAPLISWRIQGDALQTRFFSSTQNNVRISTGIVVHF